MSSSELCDCPIEKNLLEKEEIVLNQTEAFTNKLTHEVRRELKLIERQKFHRTVWTRKYTKNQAEGIYYI